MGRGWYEVGSWSADNYLFHWTASVGQDALRVL